MIDHSIWKAPDLYHLSFFSEIALRPVGLIEVFQKVLYHHLPVALFQCRPGGSPEPKAALTGIASSAARLRASNLWIAAGNRASAKRSSTGRLKRSQSGKTSRRFNILDAEYCENTLYNRHFRPPVFHPLFVPGVPGMGIIARPIES